MITIIIAAMRNKKRKAYNLPWSIFYHNYSGFEKKRITIEEGLDN
jgi:hypothetical protein